MRAETANDRFKRRSKLGWWIAAFVTFAFHAGFVLVNPEFDLDWSLVPASRHPFSLRASPLLSPELESPRRGVSYVPIDSLEEIPKIVNLAQAFAQLPKVWTGALWQYHDDGQASFQLWIDANGKVREVAVIDDDGPAKTEALLRLAQQLRFEPSNYRGRPTAVVGVIRLAVEDTGLRSFDR